MKTDLSHLPEDKQDELRGITEIIRRTVAPEIVILFGSHARGDWVEDEQTGYMSDYDILVIVRPRDAEGGSNRIGEQAEREVGKALDGYRVNAIAHRIDFVNAKLGERQYFFTDIRREGILLFDSGRYELGKAKELDAAERKRLAEDDFARWYPSANVFLKSSVRSMDSETASEADLKHAAFELHQATERFYTTILLAHTGYKSRTHDLAKLDKRARLHVHEVARVFPRSTPEEEKRFDLLKRAYVDARYEKDYVITRDELEHLAARVADLKSITESACRKKIDELAP